MKSKVLLLITTCSGCSVLSGNVPHLAGALHGSDEQSKCRCAVLKWLLVSDSQQQSHYTTGLSWQPEKLTHGSSLLVDSEICRLLPYES